MTGRWTFYGEIQGTVRTLDTLGAGQQAVEFPAIEVPPGETFFLTVFATAEGAGPTGTRLPFGNGTTQRPATLTCDCVQQVTTLVTTTSSTSTTSSSTTSTTTPVLQTSIANSTTTTRPTTSTLPQTGSTGSGPMAGVSLALIAVGGLLLLLAVRTGPDSPDSET